MATRSSILILAAIISFLLTFPPAYSDRRAFRATMIRREPAINLTRAAHKSRARLSILTSRLLDAASSSSGSETAQTPMQMDSDGGAYDMTFSMGTPPQQLSALADTGSDLIWAKCGACKRCAPLGSPSYYPNKSSSFSKLPCSSGLCRALESQSLATCAGAGADAANAGGGGVCDYKYSYGLASDPHHYTQGYMASETFTLGGGDAVEGIGFGCTTMSEGGYGSGSGLVGLGRGKLSLVRQLKVGAFSYCLTSDPSKSSPLLFGAGAGAPAPGGAQSTPLLKTSTFYTVNLNSITIGAVTTPGTGRHGIIFDSGTTLTFLAEPAYTLAKVSLLSQAANLTRVPGTNGYEVCFQTPSGAAVFPSMVLHFDGGGDMALKTENYFRAVDDSVSCWIVQSSPSHMSIVGNIMQMDYHIRYDLDKSVLSFQPANCDSL